MSKPWWVEDRDELVSQLLLLVLEFLVSFGIALASLIVPPFFLGWDTMVEGWVAWFGLVWLVSAFLICFGLCLRMHWKSLR